MTEWLSMWDVNEWMNDGMTERMPERGWMNEWATEWRWAVRSAWMNMLSWVNLHVVLSVDVYLCTYDTKWYDHQRQIRETFIIKYKIMHNKNLWDFIFNMWNKFYFYFRTWRQLDGDEDGQRRGYAIFSTVRYGNLNSLLWSDINMFPMTDTILSFNVSTFLL